MEARESSTGWVVEKLLASTSTAVSYRPVSVPRPVPMTKATRRPKRREIAPVGSVPAASPTTYIEIGTVATEMSGASVAPTIAPVAKI